MAKDPKSPATAVPPHWPAVPIPTPEEVYAGVSEQAKEYNLYLESILRQPACSL